MSYGDDEFVRFFNDALEEDPSLTLRELADRWDKKVAAWKAEDDKRHAAYLAMTDEEKLDAGYCVDLGPSESGPPGWHNYKARSKCHYCGETYEYIASDHPAGPGLVAPPHDKCRMGIGGIVW